MITEMWRMLYLIIDPADISHGMIGSIILDFIPSEEQTKSQGIAPISFKYLGEGIIPPNKGFKVIGTTYEG